MSGAPLRALVVEDSPTARALLVAILSADPGIRVIGEAANGVAAVRLAEELRPDVITMDVQMPEMDGIMATREIMRMAPAPILVVTSKNRPDDVQLSLDVVAAGALMLVDKPVGPESPEFALRRDHFLAMVKAMAAVKVVRHWGARWRSRPSAGQAVPAAGAAPLDVVALAASTGGPGAVQQLLAALPPAFAAPILIVQHIADGFTEGFVQWLQHGCALRVKLAEHGEPLRRATVYVAPEDRHLGVRADGRVLLSDGEAIRGFRPAADFLFESVAVAFGRRAAGVILTGMGSDGVEGLRAVHARGGWVLAQDEASSVVYGMPREAVHAGVVHVVGAIDHLAARLRDLAAKETVP